MAEKVYFIKTGQNPSAEALEQGVRKLLEQFDITSCIEDKDRVAIKIHFGEPGNITHIPAVCVRPVVETIKRQGGEPFLTDTCVLYKSPRDNAIGHLKAAEDHGFTYQNVGASVIIADGLIGSQETEVEIPGILFDKVSIAQAAMEADALMVLSHVTGHLGCGLGGAIKNIGMGLSSRKGKLRQHSVMKPEVNRDDCTGCGNCARWCPESAISLDDGIAVIDPKICIGCGECVTACRFDAIAYDWSVESAELQKRTAEHALGAVINKQGKTAFINFCVAVTKDCDCFGTVQSKVVQDIGLLASVDPVAIDTASLDLILKAEGHTLESVSYAHLDAREQLIHGEKIGLGSVSYTLIEVKA